MIGNCSKEDQIEFSASVGAGSETKSVSINTCTTADLKSFTLKSYYKVKPSSGNDIDTEFIPVTKCTLSGGKYFLESGNSYYWFQSLTTNKTLRFFGLAENNQSVTGEKFSRAQNGYIWGGSINVEKYSVQTDGGTSASTYNTSTKTGTGIYAEPSGTAVVQEDPCCAIKVYSSIPSSTKSVDLVFYHILARIRVRAKIELANNYKVKAKFLGYEFRDVGVFGSFLKVKDSSPSTISWTADEGTITRGSVRDNRFSAGTTLSGTAMTSTMKELASDSWCNVIPGAVGSNFEIVVKVAFYDSTTGYYIGTRYLTQKPNSITFAAGQTYQYDVTIKNRGGNDTDSTNPDFRLDDLLLNVTSVTVEDWGDVTQDTMKFGGK